MYAPLYSATQTPPSVKSHPTNSYFFFFFFSLISQQTVVRDRRKKHRCNEGRIVSIEFSFIYPTPVTHATARDDTGHADCQPTGV